MELEIEYRLAAREDYPKIADFHNQYFEKGKSAGHIEWLALGNPVGEAIYVLAIKGDAVIGTQCLIPYKINNNSGITVLTAKSDESCVHPEYRRQGIFRAMYDYILEHAKQRGIYFIWGFTTATNSFRKLGFEIGLPYQLALCFKNFGSAFRQLSNDQGWIKQIKVAAYLLGAKFHKRPKSCIEVIDAEVPEFIKELSEYRGNYNFSIPISEAYLRWRIIDNPYYSKSKVLIHREEKIMAFLVYQVQEDTAYVLHFNHQYSNDESTILALRSFQGKIFENNISVIKNWMFTNNNVAKQITRLFSSASFNTLTSKSHFVSLCVNDDDGFSEKELLLSRLAAFGST